MRLVRNCTCQDNRGNIAQVALFLLARLGHGCVTVAGYCYCSTSVPCSNGLIPCAELLLEQRKLKKRHPWGT